MRSRLAEVRAKAPLQVQVAGGSIWAPPPDLTWPAPDRPEPQPSRHFPAGPATSRPLQVLVTVNNQQGRASVA